MTVTKRSMERRQFLRGALAAAGSVAALPAFQGLATFGAGGTAHAAPGNGGYGPLVPTPDLRDGAMRLALPRGFQYRSFSVAGSPMSDGHLVPLAHDGMAVYNVRDGKFRLVRNHEDRNPPGLGSTAVDGNAYDQLAGGGTTTLVVNPFTRELERDFISLNGTIVNCAGGLTPWGSWITCEETNAGIPQGWNRQHGYCFEVPAAADGPVVSVPIPSMGRFAHEAVAVDPATGIVYETEDSGSTSGFYRFIPNRRGRLARGGRLQMLKVAGQSNYDTRTGQTVGVALPAEWVDIADPDPAGQSSEAVYNQGAAAGGARFSRLEGCWYGHGAIYFDATDGGNAGMGQIWEYRPGGPRRNDDRDDDRDEERDWRTGDDDDDDDERRRKYSEKGTLTLIFESSGPAQLDSPDNLAVSPKGALLLCEDGDNDQYLRGVTLDGRIFDFGLNLQTEHEWAGATFAVADPRWNDRKYRGSHRPLGSRSERVTLFVNRQGSTSGPAVPTPGNEGMTFAIWGPWEIGAL